jgi:uncharacterized protein (DUF927 family)
VIIWQLDLRQRMQSVPITTNVVSSYSVHGEGYSIQQYVIKFLANNTKARICNYCTLHKLMIRIIVFNVTFNNIPVILLRSVLLM